MPAARATFFDDDALPMPGSERTRLGDRTEGSRRGLGTGRPREGCGPGRATGGEGGQGRSVTEDFNHRVVPRRRPRVGDESGRRAVFERFAEQVKGEVAADRFAWPEGDGKKKVEHKTGDKCGEQEGEVKTFYNGEPHEGCLLYTSPSPRDS